MGVVNGPVATGAALAGLDDPSCGAAVVFEGRIRNRNEGREVSGLEYEIYEPLAIGEGDAIIDEARARWPITAARCVHGHGEMSLGDVAVVVAVLAPHRAEAFEAACYIIDEVKARLPIWKKEQYLDGETEWVNCQRCAEA